MKILVLSYEYPPIGGGGGIICKNISENLASLGNRVTILTTALPNKKSLKSNIPADKKDESAIHQAEEVISALPETKNNHKLKIIRLPSMRKKSHQSNPLEMLSWIHKTKKFIKNKPGFIDFDICMAHFVMPGGEVALWLKKKYKLPYVLISHGHEIPWVHPRQMFFLHAGAYFRIKKACNRSELNFVQTAMMKANIDKFSGKKYRPKNIIIPNGADTQLFYPDPGKRKNKLRIIFVGRLVIQKDPMTFLKALRLLKNHTHDFEAHIIGDGNMRKKMERYVQKNGLSENTEFTGKVPAGRMTVEYQSAHLMAAPSLNEGMSIAALEALSCGVYLIATRASGFEDMIQAGVNGEFVPFRNPPYLANRLINFYENRMKPEKPETSIKTVKSWKTVTLQYQKILENICAGNTPHAPKSQTTNI